MVFRTDENLWYNVGIWGELGYAVPNFGNDPTTLNNTIAYLVKVIGRNLQAVLLHSDADLTTPPSINTLTRIHKLVLRARSILAGRVIPPGTPDMEAYHAQPSPEDFLIYPTPYFRVRNAWLKEWCGLMLNALSEATQHTENRKAYEISTAFGGLVGQYVHRVYRLMATELFGIPVEEAMKLDFTLTDEQLGAYDPGQFFTSTEMTDVVPVFDQIPTEDDLKVLTAGIPATQLVGLSVYPGGRMPSELGTRSESVSTSSGAFPAAPSP